MLKNRIRKGRRIIKKIRKLIRVINIKKLIREVKIKRNPDGEIVDLLVTDIIDTVPVQKEIIREKMTERDRSLSIVGLVFYG